MPQPRSGESRASFVDRCVKDPEIRNTPSVKNAKDPNKAAVGRCEGVYDQHEKKERQKSAEPEGENLMADTATIESEPTAAATAADEPLATATVEPNTSLKKNPLPAEPDWLRMPANGDREIGVDREKKIIKGYVAAQEGPFKSEGRGEFDKQSLRSILKMANSQPNGLKSRFGHPGMSDDGLGKFLGRGRNYFMGKVNVKDADGNLKQVDAVRGDLHLDKAAFEGPNGNLGDYLMNLAESDPEAFSSSLVLMADKETRVDSKSRPLTDETGKELPPLWRPTKLHASDVVDTGDAVDGFLSAGIDIDALPDAALRRGVELLDKAFDGAALDVVAARLAAFGNRYLNLKAGDASHPQLCLLPATKEVGTLTYTDAKGETQTIRISDAAALKTAQLDAAAVEAEYGLPEGTLGKLKDGTMQLIVAEKALGDGADKLADPTEPEDDDDFDPEDDALRMAIDIIASDAK